MSFVIEKPVKPVLYYKLTCGHCRIICGILETEIKKKTTLYPKDESVTEYLWNCVSCKKENVEMFNLPIVSSLSLPRLPRLPWFKMNTPQKIGEDLDHDWFNRALVSTRNL